MSTPESLQELLAVAREARGRAYAPYSRFAVGAAVRDEHGRVFAGVNVENASYGLSICAERVAVFAAIANGARRIVAVAVVADAAHPATPCGACRQVLAEFAGEAEVAMGNLDGSVELSTVQALLPAAFRLDPAGPAAG